MFIKLYALRAQFRLTCFVRTSEAARQRFFRRLDAFGFLLEFAHALVESEKLVDVHVGLLLPHRFPYHVRVLANEALVQHVNQ